MIEHEISLIMRCDGCDGVLIDDYGHIVKTIVLCFGNDKAYDDIYEIAKEKGWLCDTKGCLCPNCLKQKEILK